MRVFPLIYILLIFFFLFCNKNPQEHSPEPLLLEVTADSGIPLGDTLNVELSIEGGEGRALSYCWMREPSWTIDTTTKSSFATCWTLPDTGKKRIIAWAFDTFGNESNKDTVSITVTYKLPTLSIKGDSATSVYTACSVHFEGKDNDGEISFYTWSLDRRNYQTLASDAESLLIRWTPSDTGTQLLTMTATDDDGLVSPPESLIIHVRPSGPEVHVSGDSTVSINDTTIYICTPENETDNNEIMAYRWSVDDNGDFWQSTESDSFSQVWSLSDTGIQIVRVRAEFSSGLYSPPESLTVTVAAHYPTVETAGSYQVIADDTVIFTAHASDANGTIERFTWTFETSDGDSSIITDDSLVSFTWPQMMVGKRVLVRVTVTDDDALTSEEATSVVLIKSGDLMLVPFNDTTLSYAETLLVKRILIDTFESASQYYWDTDGTEGWDTVTTDRELQLTYTGVTPVTVICGVGDSSESLFQDTFTVQFNRPPEIQLRTFTGNDTVWLPVGNIPGSLTFDYTITDPEGDTWSAFIVWKKDAVVDTITLSSLAQLPIADTGVYQWEISCCDAEGNRSQTSGSTCIGREYTVCFTGHSIIVGYGDTTCDNGNGSIITCPTTAGGVRPGVLAALREQIGFNERLRAVGPLTTSTFMNPVDDSCFAFNGAYARELLLLMDQAYITLSADIWVLMLGVNGGFSGTEINSTVSIIQNILIRNPEAKVYVVTAPIHSSVIPANYRNYNTTIRSKVASFTTGGYSTFIVEGDSLLCDGYDVYDSLFSSDLLHPNHEGYQLLKDEIVDVMFNSSPPVLEFKKEE